MKKRIVHQKPDPLISFRERLGISQKEFGIFCGVSKSAIALAESNQRILSLSNTDVLAFVQAFAENEMSFPDTVLFAGPTEKEKMQLTALLEKWENSLLNPERKIKVMSFTYRQAVYRKKFCAVLLPKITDTDSANHRLATLWEQSAIRKQMENSPFRQKLLEVERQVLQNRIQLLKQLLG